MAVARAVGCFLYLGCAADIGILKIGSGAVVLNLGFKTRRYAQIDIGKARWFRFRPVPDTLSVVSVVQPKQNRTRSQILGETSRNWD